MVSSSLHLFDNIEKRIAKSIDKSPKLKNKQKIRNSYTSTIKAEEFNFGTIKCTIQLDTNNKLLINDGKEKLRPKEFLLKHGEKELENVDIGECNEILTSKINSKLNSYLTKFSLAQSIKEFCNIGYKLIIFIY